MTSDFARNDRGRNTDFQSVRPADILSDVPSAGYKPAGRTGHKACVPGSIRASRVSFGASPKKSLVHGKVRDRESAIAPSRTGDSTRGACAPREEARVYDGNGNRRVNSRTLPRIRSRAALSSRFCSASATRSAISSISSSRMPRVVTAGVPTRIPPGLKMG